jgi:hypothetical protein
LLLTFLDGKVYYRGWGKEDLVKIIIVLSTSLLTAALSFAEFGSIISSFVTTRPPEGVCRDAAFVYVIGKGSPQFEYLQKYTAAGSFVSEIRLPDGYTYGDLEACHLGTGYLTAASSYGFCFIAKSTGSFVSYVHAPGPGGEGSDAVAWNGQHYYISSRNARGEFRRYTPTGSFAGAWLAPGWPGNMTMTGGIAFAHRARGRAGDYLVCSGGGNYQPTAVLNLANGSLVGTFGNPQAIYVGASYGDSSQPATYGAAYWVCYGLGAGVSEIDIGATGGNAVAPASIGRIKAVYR